jgi:hypothetical protein
MCVSGTGPREKKKKEASILDNCPSGPGSIDDGSRRGLQDTINLFELCRLPQRPCLTLHPLGGSTPCLWPLFLLRAKGKRKEMSGTQHVGTLKHQFLQYITIKNVFVLFFITKIILKWIIPLLFGGDIYRQHVTTFLRLAWVGMSTPAFGEKRTFQEASLKNVIFSWESVILRPRAPPIYYSGCTVFGRLVTFECFDQFWPFLLIIASLGDISKLQLYIWSSYGILAEIKKFFSLSSPLFFEVYGLFNETYLRKTCQCYFVSQAPSFSYEGAGFLLSLEFPGGGRRHQKRARLHMEEIGELTLKT